jgi:hypothetical protein
MFIVTVLGSSPVFYDGEEAWMLANHCARIGDNAFLLYDQITLLDAYKKFLGLVSQSGRVSVFSVNTPLSYQGAEAVQERIGRLLGEECSGE